MSLPRHAHASERQTDGHAPFASVPIPPAVNNLPPQTVCIFDMLSPRIHPRKPQKFSIGRATKPVAVTVLTAFAAVEPVHIHRGLPENYHP